MEKLTSCVWRWGPALLMMAVIFMFSSIPSAELPDFDWADRIVKKGGHALGYGLLALSYLHALKGDRKNLNARWFIAAWVIATLYSATDEFHQSFTPGRHPAVTDVMIDSVGALVALALASKFYKQKRPAIPTGR